jgi:hypothetical protein
LESRTPTSVGANATSTQSVLPVKLLFRHDTSTQLVVLV